MCIGGLHPPQANRGSYYCSNKHLSAEGIGRSKIVREKKGEQTQKKRKNTNAAIFVSNRYSLGDRKKED